MRTDVFWKAQKKNVLRSRKMLTVSGAAERDGDMSGRETHFASIDVKACVMG